MINLKQILKKIIILKKLMIWINLKRNPPIDSVTYWIDKSVKNEKINVVQIGSNDGKTGDPLFILIEKNKNWQVLFVEPIPYLFQKLKSNYKSKSRFRFENVAINDGSSQIFYWVNKDANSELLNLPDWYDKLGSFDKNNIIKHLGEGLVPYIMESKLQGMSLTDLLKKHRIKKLDILHIDTEGYDWKILSQLNLIEYSPIIILFEHIHLQNEEKRNSLIFLEELYYVFEFKRDLLCIKKDKNRLPRKDLNLLLEKYLIKEF